MKIFGPDIWIVDGPTVRAFGFPFPTRMIVVKLGNGSLWVNSPVQALPSELQALAAIGPVKYLVAPTALHVWRLQECRQIFPAAELWGPPGVRGNRSARYPNVLGDAPPNGWAGDLDQLIFRGNAFLNEVYFLHVKSRTLIVADFIQNYPAEGGRFFRNALMKLGGVLDGGVGIDIRLSFFNRRAARKSLGKLLFWDFERLIVAHGECLETGAKEFVRRVFHWLGR